MTIENVLLAYHHAKPGREDIVSGADGGDWQKVIQDIERKQRHKPQQKHNLHKHLQLVSAMTKFKPNMIWVVW